MENFSLKIPTVQQLINIILVSDPFPGTLLKSSKQQENRYEFEILNMHSQQKK